MNRKTYFATLGKHTQEQVNGQTAILDEAIRRGASLTLTAYALATAHHETGGTFGPITENLNYTTAERIRAVWPKRFPTLASAQPYVKNPKGLANLVYGGRYGNRPGTNDGYDFRGRSIPQLTFRDNYKKWGLEDRPDDIMKPDVGARVLFDGLGKGMFTGRKVSDYKDYKSMRATVNPDGNGATIAAYADKYERALRAAGYGSGSGAVVAVGAGTVGAAVTGVQTGSIWPWLAVSAILIVGFIIFKAIRK